MEAENVIIHSMDVNIDETHLITASSDKVVRVLKIDEGDITTLCELETSNGPVTSAIFIINKGELICASCYTGEIIIWKLEDDKYSKKFEKKIIDGAINTIKHTFLETSFIIYAGCSDGNLLVLEYDTKFNCKEKRIFCHKFGISSLSVNSQYLLTGGMDNSTILFKVPGLEKMATFLDHKGFVRCVGLCAISEFGFSCFATCSDDKKVIIYTENQDKKFNKQVIDLAEPVYSLDWSKSGYSLSVGFGSDGVKHFVPDVSGLFKEAEIDVIN